MRIVRVVAALAIASLAVLTFAIPTASAQSASPYGMAGCGLGSVLFGSDDGVIQILASTFNSLTATQTFGITTGTSNCVDRGVIRQDREQEAFFEMNYDQIREDMSAGQGEHLQAMSSLLGCSADVQPQLASFSQSHYEQIFPTAETTPMQALYSYKLQLSQQENFAQACARL